MKDAQKPDHISLNTLVNRLRDGQFVIPDFQREFEWEPWDINELMRSIFRDYYIGSLLLWAGKPENYDSLACEHIYGFAGEREDRKSIVLDGQQRLTAMYYSFMAPNVPAPKRRNRYLYFIRVDKFSRDEDDAFVYDWTRRGSTLLKDEQRQFREHMFPLAKIGEGGWSLPNWAQGYAKYWRETAENTNGDESEQARENVRIAEEFGQDLQEISEQYQVAYIELKEELELDKVCDIFTQINSRGVRLDAFDLLNALLRPKGLRLKQMWRDAEPRLQFIQSDRMNVYVLQVMSLLRQGYCSPKYLYYLIPETQRRMREPDGTLRSEVLVNSTEEFEGLWDQAIAALEEAVKIFRHPQELGAISYSYLPYSSILPALASLLTEADRLDSAKRLSAKDKIDRWYWASVFTNRYSGSVESTSARDFTDVTNWLEYDVEPEAISEFRTNLEQLNLAGETRRGTSVYNGVFNLLVRRGAPDWISGNAPQHEDLDDHHIAPQSWGRNQPLDMSIDTILNRTPLTSETNRAIIRDRLPNEYLPELISQNGEDRVRSVLESHFISNKAFDILLREDFGPADYREFVVERRKTLLEHIAQLA